MAAEVTGALTQSDPNRVLSSAFKLRITQRDLATLQEGGWLNDEVGNYFLVSLYFFFSMLSYPSFLFKKK